ncbi:MAG TPA: nucleoside triphosphate pyrophosphohydrolase [Blastocatellia bacterium]|nr:nucleoside triphosphate pyrophosphohydrolase [Blastocatellia bacterium]
MEQREFHELVALVARLRAPDGCPWDREQTYETLRPMIVEEAYEVVEAIESGDRRKLADELGDLLFQVVFCSQIASDNGEFEIRNVIGAIHDKMVRRHPHVFGDAQIETAADVLKNWDDLKRSERKAAGHEHPKGLLESVSGHLAALLEAYSLTDRASRVGFDWPSVEPCLEKLEEEITELRHEIVAEARDRERVEDEVGDLLFAAVNVARQLGVDPETALKRTNRKFRTRFGYIERRLEDQERTLKDASLEEMDALWNEAKRAEG